MFWTIIIGVVVGVVIILALIKTIKNKKAGKCSSCMGGNCEFCKNKKH